MGETCVFLEYLHFYQGGYKLSALGDGGYERPNEGPLPRVGPLSPKSVLLRGKLAEGILLTYEKAMVYLSISSLTRLGHFLGQEPGLIHFGDLRAMLGLVWVAETASLPPCPLLSGG